MENVSAWIKFLDLINSLLDKLKNLIGWIGSKSPIIIRLKRNMPKSNAKNGVKKVEDQNQSNLPAMKGYLP